MEQWERNYYITSLAGSNNGSSVVIMSTGIQFHFDAFSPEFACSVPGSLCNKRNDSSQRRTTVNSSNVY
jgi:hypothetical protein